METLEDMLKDVTELIIENKNLQEKYPDYKWELKVSLNSLEEIQKEIVEAIHKRDRCG